MKVKDLLVRIRDALNDNGERWSDDKIIRLIDEAQTDIVNRFKLLRTSKKIFLQDKQDYVDLPDDLLWLDRVAFNNQVVPLTTFDEMDKKVYNWVTDEGTKVERIVVDKMNRGRIRLYPILRLKVNYNFVRGESKEKENYRFNQEGGELVSLDMIDIFNSNYGFVTDIKNLDDITCEDLSSVEMNSDFGVITDIESFVYYKNNSESEQINYGEIVYMDDATFSKEEGFIAFIIDENNIVVGDDYGLIVGYTELNAFLEVYYVKRPKPLTSLDDKLEIDDVYAKAIKHYVVGMCFREDLDVQNRGVGNEELQLYEQALMQAKRDSFRDFVKTSSREKYEIHYRGFI